MEIVLARAEMDFQQRAFEHFDATNGVGMDRPGCSLDRSVAEHRRQALGDGAHGSASSM